MTLGTDKMTAEQKAIAIGVLNYLIQGHSSEIVSLSDRLRVRAMNIPSQKASVSLTSFEMSADSDPIGGIPGLTVTELAAMQSWIEQIGQHRLAIYGLVQRKLAIFGDESARMAFGDSIERDILAMAKAIPVASLQPRDVT